MQRWGERERERGERETQYRTYPKNTNIKTIGLGNRSLEEAPYK